MTTPPLAHLAVETPLDYPDKHHLSAAAGWRELGCPRDSQEELQRITPGFKLHYSVLTEWYAVLLEQENLDALEVLAHHIDMIYGLPKDWTWNQIPGK